MANLKPLSQQVIVITGASSGIGLATARSAAAHGARLVLVARNGEALAKLAEELAGQGAQVATVVADVADSKQLRQASTTAVERFGGFDTWINNAGISIYGLLQEVSLEDQRRLFDTNYWGVVNGSLIAAEHLQQRGAGAIINLGSELSEVSVPLQGSYSASKHAVKGFTDALRVELGKSNPEICVTLIKPAGISTPFTEHAKNYMDVEPELPAPVYSPQLAAQTILYAAGHPSRELFVGGASKITSELAHFMPRTVDWVMKRFMFRMQRTNREANGAGNALYGAGTDLKERPSYQPRHVFQTCAATAMQMKPARTGVLLAASAAALLGLTVMQTRRRHTAYQTGRAGCAGCPGCAGCANSASCG